MVRRPQDPSAGIILANGICAFHLVYGAVCFYLLTEFPDQTKKTAYPEKEWNSTACIALKKKEDYFTKHDVKGKMKTEWINIEERHRVALGSLFMAHALCGITLFLSILIRGLNKNLFGVSCVEIFTMPIY